MVTAPMLLLWLAVVNGAAWLAFAEDKRRAQAKEWRIAESALIGLALLGGAPGAWAAQSLLRHKTRKEPFRTGLPVLSVVWAGTTVAALYGLAR
jgi:uncharacterized membrane protein YsdA (DUF1294 family)